jgi:hypothetical protein
VRYSAEAKWQERVLFERGLGVKDDEERVILGRPASAPQTGGAGRKVAPTAAVSSRAKSVPLPVAPAGVPELGGLNVASETKKQEGIRPSIAIGAGGAVFLTLILLIFGNASVKTLEYNDATALQRYAAYRHAIGGRGIPTVKDVGSELNNLAHLERTGREAEAKAAWLRLIASTGRDKNNPLYQMALEHLQR